MSGFAVEVAEDGAECVIAVSGEVDIEHAADLAGVGRLVTESLDGHRLVIDLANVRFMDSTGLGALIQIRNDATASGHTVELRSLHPRVQKILEITGLTDVFDIAPTNDGPT